MLLAPRPALAHPDPLTGLIGHPGAVVGPGPLEGLMQQIWQSCSELFAAAFTVADATATVSLSTTSGTLGALWPLSLCAGALIAGCVFVGQLLRGVRRGSRVGAAVGPLKYTVAVTATAGCVSGLLGITDAATAMLLHQVLHAHSFGELAGHLPVTAEAVAGVSSVTLGLVGLFGLVPAAFGYATEMIYQQAAIVVLIATVPITAAGLLARSTARWWWTTLRWGLTATLMKPALVLVLAVALGPLVGAHGLFGLLGAGAVSWVALGCPWVLYRLSIFLTPAVEPDELCQHRAPATEHCGPSRHSLVAARPEWSASPSRTGFAAIAARPLAESVGLAGDSPLPDPVIGLEVHDGPRFRGHGHIGLIHDPRQHRWAATATVSLPPNTIHSESWCLTLATTLGTVLSRPATTGHSTVADQVSLLIRTIPDNTPDRPHDIIDPGPPLRALRRISPEDHDAAEGARHEIFVTISGSETALRRPAQTAGGGSTGRAWAIYRLLDDLHQALTSGDVGMLTWCSSAGLSGALRDGVRPATSTVPDQTHTSLARRALPCAETSLAAPPELAVYTHGEFTTLTYTVAPEPGTSLDELTTLLANPDPRERRCLSLHLRSECTTLPRYRPRPSVPEVLEAVLTPWRRRATSPRSPRHSPARTRLAPRPRTVANPPPRTPTQRAPVANIPRALTATVFAAITVPADQPIDDPAARLERDAAARFQLRRAQEQDAAFVTACLPVGLPGHRSTGR
jgi:hypothetical protein